MRPASRFLGGLGLIFFVVLYVEAALPWASDLLSSVPYVGAYLLGPLAYLLPYIVAAAFWTGGYLAMFGGLVPRAKLAGKKVGTCENCGYSWELGKGDAVRFWFRTRDEGEEDLTPDTQCARICPKCGHRLEPWSPMERKDDAKLPERLRTPPSYPR